MDWLEAIAARKPLVDPSSAEFRWAVPLTVGEVDRLVALARGVERLAEQWEREGFDKFAIELRRLLDGRDE
jgi:hypothetical protein